MAVTAGLAGPIAELRADLATKAGLAEVRTGLAEVRTDLVELRTALSAELARHVAATLEEARAWFRRIDDRDAGAAAHQRAARAATSSAGRGRAP